jgi:hypothetical protein
VRARNSAAAFFARRSRFFSASACARRIVAYSSRKRGSSRGASAVEMRRLPSVARTRQRSSAAEWSALLFRGFSFAARAVGRVSGASGGGWTAGLRQQFERRAAAAAGGLLRRRATGPGDGGAQRRRSLRFIVTKIEPLSFLRS